MQITVPCTVVPNDGSGRAKFNVDPGASGAQVVLLNASKEQLAELRAGRIYEITITEAAEQPEEQSISSGDVGDAEEVLGSQPHRPRPVG